MFMRGWLRKSGDWGISLVISGNASRSVFAMVLGILEIIHGKNQSTVADWYIRAFQHYFEMIITKRLFKQQRENQKKMFAVIMLKSSSFANLKNFRSCDSFVQYTENCLKTLTLSGLKTNVLRMRWCLKFNFQYYLYGYRKYFFIICCLKQNFDHISSINSPKSHQNCY